MKKTTLFLLFFFSLQVLNAQETFEKTFGNPGIFQAVGKSSLQSVDGGYIITGSITNYNSLSDIYIIKTDAKGDTLWTRAYGSENCDVGNSIIKTTDGGYIIAATASTYQCGVNAAYLLKLNSEGDSLWSNSYVPNVPNSEATASSVKQTNDGGYIFVGNTSLYGKNIFIVKTDESGNTLWTKNYWGQYPQSIEQTNDGSYILTGKNYTQGTSTDVLLMKISSSGDSLWARTYDIYQDNDEGHSVIQTSSGNFLIAGTSWIGYGNSDICLIKTNSVGDTIWTKRIGGDKLEMGKAIKETSDGNFIIVGSTQSFGNSFEDVYLIKIDTNGDTLWTKTFGFGESTIAVGSSVNQTSDGGYIIGGELAMLGSNFAYLIKTNADGIVTSLLYSSKIPETFSLYQNYPNPFNPSTTIKYSLPAGRQAFQNVTLRVYDILGKEVATLVNETQQPGNYEIKFNAGDLPSGIYLYKINIGNHIATRKMMLLK
ncbi:hypothetical protein MNBD_IGNAVI01-761 [hydrothermal vent metagenome]|uniref:Secretion system C-terminal sorting domain-containing protein n=1 Tax=hydrothermal vent metagenome TaxID=652676 RepID=A0A3B1BQL9_9ZZZZ